MTARGVHVKELKGTLINEHKSLHLCPASHVVLEQSGI